MDDLIYQKYVSLIYTHSGIALGETKKELVRARVAKRMRALGISEYKDYYEYVDQDLSQKELALLLDVISTNVTSFFREKDHFDFISSLMKKWYATGQRKFRFWSAGCSTGEEPFSLAITILESLLEERYPNMKILATDISRKALEIAKKGIYEKEKLGHLTFQELKYFKPIGQNQMKIRDLVRDVVVFNYLNLRGEEYPFQGPFDVIFCRNVMIYFDGKGRKDIISRFHKLLRVGGYLFVGHSESLLRTANGFEYIRPSIYQKQSMSAYAQ